MKILAKIMGIENRNKVVAIPLDDIVPSPYQPRKYFNEEDMIELSESIRQYGVIQPIIVRRMNNGVGKFEIIAGERRYRACRMANLANAPCICYDLDDNDSAVLALIENLQRKDLYFMEEAEGYRKLLNEHGFTQDELSQKVGKNQSTISNKMRLLRLSDDMKQIIFENQLTERHSRALLRLPEELQINIVKIICERGLNVSQTEKLVENTLCKLQNDQPKRTKKHIMRDVRIIVNTMKQTMDIIKKQGLNAYASKSENDEFIEYVIKIPKTG